ncbi:hypothetical protein [Enterovibrio calviensis]|uniref:hypothetical protein n=1 Tax=Enterovibrio calviensis TaxID=91359 RepID=UPI0037366CB1
MVKNTLFSTMFICVLVVSLGQKFMRYSGEIAYSKHEQMEHHFLATVAYHDWEMTLKAPMNTNNSSYVYVLSRAECDGELLVSILSEDASDNLLLAQYLGHGDIYYFLDGKPIDKLITAFAYVARLKTSLFHIMNKPSPPPLLLAVAGPITKEGCTFDHLYNNQA